MPQWMTSLLRDDVSRPNPSCISATTRSRDGSASCSATARPITPAPMMRTSISSMGTTIATISPLQVLSVAGTAMPERAQQARQRPLVVIGADAIPRLTQFCRETARRLLLVADVNTYHAIGEAVEAGLRGIGCEVRAVVFRGGEVVADAHHLLRVFLASGGTDLAFVSVGSGTITDITRFVSHRTGGSFISVPTAPSVDGYTSIGAPLIVDGIKTTANAHAPLAIFADLAALCAAPQRMIAAGFGDMLGKHTSVADWRLAHLLWDLPYDESI